MNFKKIIKTSLSVTAAAFIILNSGVLSVFSAADMPLHKTNTTVYAADEDKDLKYEDIPIKYFAVCELSPDADTDMDYVEWWYSEWEDCRYIFLPATADRSRIFVDYDSRADITLNGERILTGQMTDIFSKADEFEVKAGGTYCGKLKIMQSDHGCIYIRSKGSSFEELDANRNLTPEGTAVMLDADGNTVYSGEIEKISAHGNSSWTYSKKKPYNIKLPKKADLFGMGKAKKWVLLSNYLDHSMLRNKLTEELCRAAGMECVMDSVFVDLYTDGSYRGTYQLCEKVQIQKQRVNITDLGEKTEELNDKPLKDYPRRISGTSNVRTYAPDSYKCYDIPNAPDDITGGYLLEFIQWNRYGSKAKSGFVTSRGQAISIEGPEYATVAQTEYISELVQDMEDAIYSDTGFNAKGKHYSDYIDIDSLVRAYLVQEISMNVDATYNSFFLWKESDLKGDGKFHFSPAWDFDLSYNNFITIRTNSDGEKGYSSQFSNLFAAYFPIHDSNDNVPSCDHSSCGISWLGQLYKRKEFRSRAADIYFSDFEPFLKRLTEGDSPYLMEIAHELQPTAEMSNARWHTYGGADYTVFGYSSGATYMESVDIVRSFIEKRTGWLSELWEGEVSLRGDVNYDGKFNVADVIVLQNWLLGNGRMLFLENADINTDGVIDVFDLVAIKRELLSG